MWWLLEGGEDCVEVLDGCAGELQAAGDAAVLVEDGDLDGVVVLGDLEASGGGLDCGGVHFGSFLSLVVYMLPHW